MHPLGSTDLPSGLAVPIRIPPSLAQVRRRWDRAAKAGALAHVTVLYPFLPTSGLTPDVRVQLAAIARSVSPFEVRFARVRRFDDGVVWVAPEPATPFQALTAAAVACWPDHPPYGGIFDAVIPHLTVVESDVAPLAEVEALARRVTPFTARAERLELWRQGEDGRWLPHWRLRLGGQGPGGRSQDR